MIIRPDYCCSSVKRKDIWFILMPLMPKVFLKMANKTNVSDVSSKFPSEVHEKCKSQCYVVNYS